MEVALTLTCLSVATSVFDDDAAVDIEPRGSLPCAAWKRDTVVFMGGAPGAEGAVTVPGASGKARSKFAGVGVGGGDMKATFLCTSFDAVVTLPFVVLRELRPAESCSWRGEVVRSGTVSAGCDGVGVGEEYGGVGVGVDDEDSVR